VEKEAAWLILPRRWYSFGLEIFWTIAHRWQSGFPDKL
jgi:hypothetical protein